MHALLHDGFMQNETSSFSGTVTAESFTEHGDEYAAVNLRIGAVDLDLTPAAAEDLARKLIDAAAALR